MRVVVFADDPTEGRVISVAMREFGITAAAAPDLVTRMERWEEDPGDVIILASNKEDLPLKELDTICQVTKAAPILVLHEPVPDTQECLLLEHGAVLMLDRPVSLRLLSNYLKVFSRLAASVPSTILNEMALEHIVLDHVGPDGVGAGRQPYAPNPIGVQAAVPAHVQPGTRGPHRIHCRTGLGLSRRR